MFNITQRFTEIQRQVLLMALHRRKRSGLLFLVTTILSSACTVGAPLIFAYSVSTIKSGGFSVQMLLAVFGIYAALLGAIRVLTDVKMVVMRSIEQDVRLETNKMTLSALLQSAGSIFVSNNPARVAELVNNLHQSNAIYIQSFLIVVLSGIVDMLFAFTAIAGLVSWIVAAFVIIYGAATVALTLRANKVTAQFQRQARRKSAEGTNLLGNVVSNIVSIKIFQGQSWVQDLYEKFASSARDSWQQYFLARLKFGSLQALLIFVQYASILAMLVFSLNSGDLLSQVVLVGMILMQLNRPFEMIASSIEEYAMARVLAEMLQQELDQHRRIEVTPNGSILDHAKNVVLELRDLRFGFHPEQPLFQDLSARFEAGRMNFIVGQSGVGKSTLLQILLAINGNYSGSVLANGVELREVNPDNYLAQIGYVAQEPMMMNLSIRDNILFGRPYDDDRIMETLRIVRLIEKVQSLPEGLDFVIGERGQLLSGGERQRLAIARALIAQPRLLILDEASSSLDEDTEKSIFTALRDKATDTTVIAVTHRLGVIDGDDCVLNLDRVDDGEFVEASIVVPLNR